MMSSRKRQNTAQSTEVNDLLTTQPAEYVQDEWSAQEASTFQMAVSLSKSCSMSPLFESPWKAELTLINLTWITFSKSMRLLGEDSLVRLTYEPERLTWYVEVVVQPGTPEQFSFIRMRRTPEEAQEAVHEVTELARAHLIDLRAGV
jgi:hypothetical protein